MFFSFASNSLIILLGGDRMLEDIKIETLKISKQRLEQLHRLDIYNVNDLLTFYPYRYDHIEVTMPSNTDNKIAAQGVIVTQPRMFYIRKGLTRLSLDVSIEDVVYSVTIFNRQFLMQHLHVGKEIIVVGKCDINKRSITASDIKLKSLEEATSYYPVYRLTDGISSKTMQSIINKALTMYREQIDDFIPAKFIDKYHLVNRYQALFCIHNPRDEKDIKHSYRHLKYEEFLRFQLVMQYLKHQVHDVEVGIRKDFDRYEISTFINNLPFPLTPDQKTSIEEILTDLSDNQVMYRLLQGDVGSGKTVVASIGLYANALAGYQGAMMAPTEILAKQHYTSLTKLFKNTSLKIELLTGSLSIKDKQSIYTRLKNHEIDILVGTHAIIQEKVTFSRLGLVIADEQHRFGVNQRKMLKDKGTKVDFLLMSATPIPRTLAISLFGDMDISTIKTMPMGRVPIQTTYIKAKSMKPILDEATAYLQQNGQIYVICPLIEESEVLASRDAVSIYEGMRKYFHNDYVVGLLHGKMSDEEKEMVMADFRDNKIQILVSTTVIEVGVDVSNANMMVIYDAERFGLSQLHQLRGRIGRGTEEGKCYLLSNSDTEEAKARLNFIASTTDGFEISNYDLQLRGPGEVLGHRQSGLPTFLLADIFADFNILEAARNDAKEIIEGSINSDDFSRIMKYLEVKIASNIEYMG